MLSVDNRLDTEHRFFNNNTSHRTRRRPPTWRSGCATTLAGGESWRASRYGAGLGGNVLGKISWRTYFLIGTGSPRSPACLVQLPRALPRVGCACALCGSAFLHPSAEGPKNFFLKLWSLKTFVERIPCPSPGVPEALHRLYHV